MFISISLRIDQQPIYLSRFQLQIRVEITPGSHDTEADTNKQLADKERVSAAMENPALARMVNECLVGSS